MPNICLYKANLSLNHIFIQFTKKFIVYNVLISMKKEVVQKRATSLQSKSKISQF